MIKRKPKYLELKGKKKMISMIARFRCGNEWKGEKYWETEEGKLCRLCGCKRETWQHIKQECSTRTELSDEDIMINYKEGEGITWMRQVCEKRREAAALDKNKERKLVKTKWVQGERNQKEDEEKE